MELITNHFMANETRLGTEQHSDGQWRAKLRAVYCEQHLRRFVVYGGNSDLLYLEKRWLCLQ